MGLFALVIHQYFTRWNRLFIGALQVGTVYSQVLCRLELATHRWFAGCTDYSPVVHRLEPTIHRWFIGWHWLFTGGSPVGTSCSQFRGQVTYFTDERAKTSKKVSKDPRSLQGQLWKVIHNK
ncbi:hypothetical protein HAX54_017785, partial [Datura stramonium]|nr:hypothetical protein [Datura stramonium]